MLGWLISSMIRRSMNALELPNQGSESGAADNTRGIFDAFLEGVDGGARYESAGAAGLREQRVPWNRRQFYWEGFALGASARQALNPFSRGGPQRRYSAPGYWFMFYTGVGFYNGAAEQRYLPRIPVDADSFAGSPDFMMGRPLIAGGISFAHIASNVKWDPALVRHLLIEGDEDWNRGVWMGCGRGLWFLYMREFD